MRTVKPHWQAVRKVIQYVFSFQGTSLRGGFLPTDKRCNLNVQGVFCLCRFRSLDCSYNISHNIQYVNNTDGDLQFGDQDDSLTVTFGGNYDFEVVKLYAGAQYIDEIKRSKMKGVIQDVSKFNSGNGFADRMKGWSLGVSAGIPVAGGTVMVGAAYLDAEAADSESSEKTRNDELPRWIVSAGYDYPFSKRTDVYGVVTYNQDSIDNVGAQDIDPSVWGVMIGLRHRF